MSGIKVVGHVSSVVTSAHRPTRNAIDDMGVASHNHVQFSRRG